MTTSLSCLSLFTAFTSSFRYARKLQLVYADPICLSFCDTNLPPLWSITSFLNPNDFQELIDQIYRDFQGSQFFL